MPNEIASARCRPPRNDARRAPALLPRPVVDRVLLGRAGRHQAPAERPLVIVVEALARIGSGRRIEDAPEPEVGEIDRAARLLDEIMRVSRRALVDRRGGMRL